MKRWQTPEANVPFICSNRTLVFNIITLVPGHNEWKDAGKWLLVVTNTAVKDFSTKKSALTKFMWVLVLTELPSTQHIGTTKFVRFLSSHYPGNISHDVFRNLYLLNQRDFKKENLISGRFSPSSIWKEQKNHIQRIWETSSADSLKEMSNKKHLQSHEKVYKRSEKSTCHLFLRPSH